MELLFIIIICFFIVGLSLSLKNLIIWFLNTNNDSIKEKIIISIKSIKDSDIEIETNLIISRLKWGNYKNIYFIDCGLELEDYNKCKSLLNNAGFKLYKQEEILNIIRE